MFKKLITWLYFRYVKKETNYVFDDNRLPIIVNTGFESYTLNYGETITITNKGAKVTRL